MVGFKIKFTKLDLKDLLIIVGGISLSRGLYMIYPPAMYLVIGAGLIWLGLPGKAVK